jgi:hypothetical protein
MRIMLTAVFGPHAALITGVSGATVTYSERMPRPTSRRAFLERLGQVGNTGNLLIGEAAMQALGPGARHVPFWHLAHAVDRPDELAALRESFDVVVFNATNILRAGLDLGEEARVLAALDLPIVVLGAGVQWLADLQAPLQPGTRRLIEMLADPRHAVLTRGEDSAAFLRQAGVARVRPVGCPTLYLAPDNMARALHRLPGAVPAADSRVSFLGHLGLTWATLLDMAALAPQAAYWDYILQDEPHILPEDPGAPRMQLDGCHDAPAYDDMTGRVLAPVTFSGSDQVDRPIAMHCFFEPAMWRGWLAAQDVCVSRRMHGAVVAMQAGTPAIMICVDDRMREVARFAGLPHLDAPPWDAAADKPALLREFLAGLDTPAAAARLAERQDGFAAGLAWAGLVPAAAPAPVAAMAPAEPHGVATASSC